MKAANSYVKKKNEQLFEAQLRTVSWNAKGNVADRKFISLVDLQVVKTYITMWPCDK